MDIRTLYLMLLALLPISCESIGGGDEGVYSTSPIVLQLYTASPNSRADLTELGDDDLNENSIYSHHTFIFESGASDSEVAQYMESRSGLSYQGTGDVSIELSVERSNFTSDAIYDVYTVVNMPSNIYIPTRITLGELKALHTITPIESHLSQSLFVMDGMTSIVMNPSEAAINIDIPIELKRAVAKIRVSCVVDPSSDVAQAESIYLSLRNFAEVGSVVSDTPYPLEDGDRDDSPFVETSTFYSYESSWGDDTSEASCVVVNIPYGSRTENYYRLPLNELERNMIYDMSIYINKDGTLTIDGEQEVESSYTITDWGSREIVMVVEEDKHYLNISDDEIVMPNVSQFTLRYAADLPISITNVTAMDIRYDGSGVAQDEIFVSGDDEFPIFTIDTSNSTITIDSEIPDNYVPKYMSFTVTNNSGLSLDATIIQYPEIYVTARTSSGNITPEYISGGTNLNLFTVNVLVPSSDGSYVLGDPTHGEGVTDSSYDGNRVVSPQFIIASQYAIYYTLDYDSAQQRCYSYGEDIYRSGWRMPTKAELEIIDMIQDDPDSAIEALLEGSAYWSAYKYEYFNFYENSWVEGDEYSYAYIRAVYDLYRDN